MNNDLISKSKLFKDLENYNIPFNEAINSVIYYQPTVNQWIDVNDRLPEDSEDVLICSQWGTIDIGWYCKGEWVSEHITYDYDNIIAWMPLPEPYKKEVE